jgi:4'-phosphopantetheinyl transferase EntD
VTVRRAPDRTRSPPWKFGGATVATRRLDDLANGDDLSRGEQALVSAARSELRRKELAAGRAAAHEALRAAGSPSPHRVLKDSDQRPRLAGSRGWFLSLAHDGDLAVAACDTHPIGVDVAPFLRRAQLERVVGSAIDAQLARPLGGEAVWPPSLLLWTAWEALGKQRGVGVLGEAMEAQLEVQMTGDCAVATWGHSRLRWWTDEENLFCLATMIPAAG